MVPLLGRLNQLGRRKPTGVFLGALALVLAGLLLPGPVGGLLLLVLAGALGALLTVTWAHHDARTRLLRVIVLTLLVVLAVAKLG
jgi:hypothetical protein